MDLPSLAALFAGVRWIGDDCFTAQCPLHDAGAALMVRQFSLGGLMLRCPQGCGVPTILAKLGLSPSDLSTNGNGSADHANGQAFEEPPREPGADEQEDAFQHDLLAWKARSFHTAETLITRDLELRKLEGDGLFNELVASLLTLTKDVKGYSPPEGLDEEGTRKELEDIARLLVPQKTTPQAERSVIIWEDQGHALQANAEYMARPAIVDRLFYAQSISCAVGGKHHGKTTNLRTLALSVARGLTIWDRPTKQGHVIYAASGDEVASTRMELLRMGWDPQKDPLLFAHVRPEQAATPERVMAELAATALRYGSVLIILDMLFDFVRIKDEMSYAGTREAITAVQVLADITKAHVASSHHSPKYMPDVATAATAALGSQGIAARFSPIVLSRRWAEGLFTVESTQTRDPRGEALPQICVERNANGWGVTTGPFKSWMKWRIYAPRVLALFEGGDPRRELTVSDVAEDLEIARPEAQNTLYQMTISDDAALQRIKRGRSYKYSLRNRGLFGDEQKPEL